MTTHSEQRQFQPVPARPEVPLLKPEVPLLKKVFGSFPTGVTALCGSVDKRPVGMAASSFTGVSLDPPLVSVCIANGSATWGRLRCSAWLGISVLSEHHGATCRQLAGAADQRFHGIAWERAQSGAVFIRGAAAWLECSLEREMPAGDHRITLLRISALGSEPGTEPLVFHTSGFRRLEGLGVR